MARRGAKMIGRSKYVDQGVDALFDNLSLASGPPPPSRGDGYQQARKYTSTDPSVPVKTPTQNVGACQATEDTKRYQLGMDPTGVILEGGDSVTETKFPSLDLTVGNPEHSSHSSSGENSPSTSSGGSLSSSSEPVVDIKKGSCATKSAATEPTSVKFHIRPREELLRFLKKIDFCERDVGMIEAGSILTPCKVGEEIFYRKEREYEIKRKLHPTGKLLCGVYLCHDKGSAKDFILKRITNKNERLVGTEFLVTHNQRFLPKIYGIAKETDTLCIFQECIEGGTLLLCEWNLEQVKLFAEVLLKSFYYLHHHDLAHCDVKLANLMVRDRNDPSSLVIIDFESSVHSLSRNPRGGQTLVYLAPWHDLILDFASFHELMKTSDLWAIACVLIFFLMPMDRKDLQRLGWRVWGKFMKKTQSSCPICSKVAHCRTYCDDCRKKFKRHVKVNGHQILQEHLGQLMSKDIEDPNWKVLKELLLYLTDTRKVQEKSISVALRIVAGHCSYPTVEQDYSIHLRP